MGSTVHPPQRRECECCDRVERWDDDGSTWRIEKEGESKLIGDPYCIHEWDITGSYNPVDSAD